MFSKSALHRFEENLLERHFTPIEKLFGDLGAVANRNSVLSLSSLRPIVRTRLIASLEILTAQISDSIPYTGVIQRNLRDSDMYGPMGITLDIPESARVPLTGHEIDLTGFLYGVEPHLLPLIDSIWRIRPCSFLSRFDARARRNLRIFPVYFSGYDRLVARSFCKGYNNEGMLSTLKGLSKAIIICASTGNSDESSDTSMNADSLKGYGLMSDIDYDSLLVLNSFDRQRLLRRLARLLICAICETTWSDLVKENVFGENPHFDIDSESSEDDRERLSLDFVDFPFTEQRIAAYSSRFENTKFVRKGMVTSNGKLAIYVCCPCHVSN
jgi:hypothetical protein